MDPREGFRWALTGGCRRGEAGSRPARSRASYVIGYGDLFGLLSWVLSWKQGQKLGTSYFSCQQNLL